MIINRFHWILAHAAMALTTALPLPAIAQQDQPNSDENGAVMLIMRGIPNSESPLGQLDDWAAVEYARRIGLRGEVLDVAGSSRADSPQVEMALDRIHRDDRVTAIYGFSAGGYSARVIWKGLSAEERNR